MKANHKFFKMDPIPRLSDAVVQSCSVKKVFLEISQSSQENNRAKVSFFPATLLKKRPWHRWCHKDRHLRCWGGPKVCLSHYSYYYRYFSDWTSFKIYLIWAHLKFHYKLLFCSASATIPESKFSFSTFSSYPIPLWQCMMRKHICYF